MKLYDNKMANSPRKVRMFLAEKNITNVEMVEINMMEGEHKTPEYRAIAPNSRIPALQLDDGTVIMESTAICRYLESLHPEPNLFGESPLEIASIEMWNARIANELMLPLAHGFRHTHPGMKELENQNEEFGLAQREVAKKSLTYFEELITNREFIAGDRFTYADIQAVTTLKFLVRLNRLNLEEWQNLNQYVDETLRRPSFSL